MNIAALDHETALASTTPAKGQRARGIAASPAWSDGVANVLGRTNSEGDDTFVAAGAGIDTVRYRFRAAPSAFERLRWLPHQVGVRGEVFVQADGIRSGCTRTGLLYTEGRLAALLEGRRSNRLCLRAELPDGAVAVRERLARLGVDAGDHVALGRLDLAAELRFDDGADGVALLRAASLLDVPWAKTGTDGRKAGGLETVYFRTVRGRKMLGRMYDKGLESGSCASGRLVRYERQLRWEKEREPTLAEALQLRLGDLYAKQLATFRDEQHDLLVVPALSGVDVIWGMVQSGAIDLRLAERLMGYVMLRSSGRTDRLPARTRQRRERALREIGLVIADDQMIGSRPVPLGRYLDALVGAWDEGDDG